MFDRDGTKAVLVVIGNDELDYATATRKPWARRQIIGGPADAA